MYGINLSRKLTFCIVSKIAMAACNTTIFFVTQKMKWQFFGWLDSVSLTCLQFNEGWTGSSPMSVTVSNDVE